MRSFLALENESERFRDPAEVGEPQTRWAAPGQPKQLGRPHNDIMGDIMYFVNPATALHASMYSYEAGAEKVPKATMAWASKRPGEREILPG